MSGAPKSSAPKLSAEELSVGETREAALCGALSRVQLVQYAGASGDFNPIHVDEAFAREAGYRTVFAPGMLIMGLAARLLTDWLGDAVLTRYGVRFLGVVWAGDAIAARAVVERIDVDGDTAQVELSIEARNQADEVVLSGYATAALPARRRPPD